MKFWEGILLSVELNGSFSQGKEEAWSATEPIITFFNDKRSPRTSFSLQMTLC